LLVLRVITDAAGSFVVVEVIDLESWGDDTQWWSFVMICWPMTLVGIVCVGLSLVESAAGQICR